MRSPPSWSGQTRVGRAQPSSSRSGSPRGRRHPRGRISPWAAFPDGVTRHRKAIGRSTPPPITAQPVPPPAGAPQGRDRSSRACRAPPGAGPSRASGALPHHLISRRQTRRGRRRASPPRRHRSRLAAALDRTPQHRLVQPQLLGHRHDRHPERRAPDPPPRARRPRETPASSDAPLKPKNASRSLQPNRSRIGHHVVERRRAPDEGEGRVAVLRRADEGGGRRVAQDEDVIPLDQRVVEDDQPPTSSQRAESGRSHASARGQVPRQAAKPGRLTRFSHREPRPQTKAGASSSGLASLPVGDGGSGEGLGSIGGGGLQLHAEHDVEEHGGVPLLRREGTDALAVGVGGNVERGPSDHSGDVDLEVGGAAEAISDNTPCSSWSDHISPTVSSPMRVTPPPTYFIKAPAVRRFGHQPSREASGRCRWPGPPVARRGHDLARRGVVRNVVDVRARPRWDRRRGGG